MHAKSIPRVEALREYASEGMSLKDAAERSGIPYYTAGRLARLTDIRFRRDLPPHKVSKVDRQLMKEMLAEGLNFTEIGRHFGVSRERVRQIAKSLGLRSPESDVACKERRGKLVDKIQSGASIEEAAETLGYSKLTAQWIACKCGVGVRSERRRLLLEENASAIEAIRGGASIRSQSNDHAHEEILGRLCRHLGILSRAPGGGGKSSVRRRERLIAAGFLSP